MLMPNHSEVAEVLSNYRRQERRMLHDPADPEISACFRDTAYTLCVLMDRRTALEAVCRAEDYLRYLRDTSEPQTPTGTAVTD
ncbi:DUF5133 domain-containing protein [Streptomyces formicae]|uniref:DUF5133 domain-containing protein n=1 Tax=Streptomyces formicae TaxID=1616117 RepID=A0ABY3WQM7_9ACTN|nr:DUF5133 domain-containing protein [Streptomyces formicae]UNM13092.1 DUF5133 domain-containing protein [Streptomyces formicae]